MKVLRVTMPDGSKWDVPADAVARNRAKHYADTKTHGASWQARFDDEYAYTMDEDDELVDWAKNNMNWSDVEVVAVRSAVPADVDFEEGWANGEMKVVEKE